VNIPDNMRCQWIADDTRCACPASLSTSRFCVFHRHAESVDSRGIVHWSQDATADEYQARAKSFMCPSDPPAVRALRAQIDGHGSGRSAGIASSRIFREPGQDEELSA